MFESGQTSSSKGNQLINSLFTATGQDTNAFNSKPTKVKQRIKLKVVKKKLSKALSMTVYFSSLSVNTDTQTGHTFEMHLKIPRKSYIHTLGNSLNLMLVFSCTPLLLSKYGLRPGVIMLFYKNFFN